MTADGSVYLSVEKVKEYGKLTGNILEDLSAGARVERGRGEAQPHGLRPVEGGQARRDILALSLGRWSSGLAHRVLGHVYRYLGETIDIHGGGNDLIFPHHENEILQSEAVLQQPLANYWMHNGMLQVQDAKMSKSLKNFFTVRTVMEVYTTEEVRFYFLNTHYRGPLNYSEDALDEAAAR